LHKKKIPTPDKVIKVKKKLFLISLLILFFACSLEDTPTTPEVEEILYGDIDAHYYRVNSENAERSDTVRLFMSWILYKSKLMTKVENDHFQLELKSVPNNIEHIGNYDCAHFISIFDAMTGKWVAEKVILNGTELINVSKNGNGFSLCFWFDGENVYSE